MGEAGTLRERGGFSTAGLTSVGEGKFWITLDRSWFVRIAAD